MTVVDADDADPAALDVVTEILRGRRGDRGRAGPSPGTTTPPGRRTATSSPTDGQSGDDSGDPDGRRATTGGLTVQWGRWTTPISPGLLDDVGVAGPDDLPPEGYALAAYACPTARPPSSWPASDAAGTFYAAQTLRQLTGDGAVAGVAVADHPAMAHRGAIEGFYGSPWTTDERLDLLAFSGRFKLNTYIYAPKDDPYHRDQWREPYPPDRLAALRTLAEAAAANHVRFTFAVSPGVSICYSDPADLDALTAKLEAVYALGVRSFSIALDDIDHTRWNCDGRRRPLRPALDRGGGPRPGRAPQRRAVGLRRRPRRRPPAADGAHRVPGHRRQPLPHGGARAARPRPSR